VRITPLSASGNKFDPETDHLAVSTDGGASWLLRDLPGTRAWNPTFDQSQGLFRWVEPVTWDSTAALFSLWSEGTTLWLARSTDEGASWTTWQIVQDSTELYFPYLVARARGDLAATWFAGYGDSLRANFAHILVNSAQAVPRVTRADPFDFPAFDWSDTSAQPTQDTAGEYLPAIFLRDGRLAVVSTIQDATQDRWGFTFRPYELEKAGR
jgi:hypothetical protein